MLYTVVATVVAMLCGAVSPSPLSPTDVPAAASSPQPTCWIPKLRKPGFERNCTFYQTTSTRTVLTDCGGCGLSTRMLYHLAALLEHHDHSRSGAYDGHGLRSIDIIDDDDEDGRSEDAAWTQSEKDEDYPLYR